MVDEAARAVPAQRRALTHGVRGAVGPRLAGRVTTSIGRKWPSFGHSPFPASSAIATRLPETVDGTGVLIGPTVIGGEFE